MLVQQHQHLYAGWDIEDAKIFCREKNLSGDKVKLIQRNGEQILVVAKREFEWE